MRRMMRSAVTMAAWLLLGAVAAAADGDTIVGLWATEPDEHGVAHIEIDRESDRYFGRIVWLSEPVVPAGDPSGRAGRPKTDLKNPDPDLRERPVLGLRIVEGFRYAGDDRWTGGRIYDPASGKSYDCKMKLLSDGRLKIRGYVGIPLLGRSTHWTRPPDPKGSSPGP